MNILNHGNQRCLIGGASSHSLNPTGQTVRTRRPVARLLEKKNPVWWVRWARFSSHQSFWHFLMLPRSKEKSVGQQLVWMLCDGNTSAQPQAFYTERWSSLQCRGHRVGVIQRVHTIQHKSGQRRVCVWACVRVKGPSNTAWREH